MRHGTSDTGGSHPRRRGKNVRSRHDTKGSALGSVSLLTSGEDMRRHVVTALVGLPAWAIPVAVFVTACVLRVGVQLLVGFYESPLRWEYDAIARNLAEGRGYYFDFLGTRWLTFGLPALPLLDGALYALSGGTDRFVAIGLALAALSAGTAAIGAAIAQGIGGRAAGVVAGIAISFHPGQIVYAAQIHEVPIETFALALALAAFIRDLRGPTRGGLIVTAAAAGLAVFVRPTYGAFVLVALAVDTLRRRKLLRPVVILLAIALFTVPWTLRSAIAIGAPRAPLAPYSCLAIWMGNNPYAPGSTIAPDGRSWWSVQPPDVQALIWGRPEIEQGRIFCEQAFEFLSADPARSLGWWMTKWSWYWWVSPQAGQFYPDTALRIYLVAWLAIAALAIIGALSLWRSRERRWDVALILALAIPISLAQSFVYVDGRHRMEIEWAILVLSAIGLTALARAQIGHYAARDAETRGT